MLGCLCSTPYCFLGIACGRQACCWAHSPPERARRSSPPFFGSKLCLQIKSQHAVTPALPNVLIPSVVFVSSEERLSSKAGKPFDRVLLRWVDCSDGVEEGELQGEQPARVPRALPVME